MAASLSARPHRQFFQFFINRRLASTSLGVQEVSTSPALKVQGVSNVEKNNEIVIPRKKKRDELSVLRALASTVTRDTNAPQYKYMDDPFLIPASSIAKKSHALSKESGRKAARYMLENYKQWFNENPAEPAIDAFMPPRMAYTYTEPTEEALLERITKRRVKDAIDVYKKMKQDQGKLSQDACRQFLELLCVYNGQDAPQTMMAEEFFFRKDLGVDVRRPSKTWKDGDMAERVYDELEDKSSEDQQNLIRGMARYLQTDKAFAMYDEMMERKLRVDRLTFNELIRVSTFHQDTYDTKWKQVESLLTDMKLSGVEPNLATFNNVLFSLARTPLYRQAPTLVLQTLNEMRGLGIEPGPLSWKHVLTVFYPNESSDSNMLYKIMDYLEGKEFVLQDPDDTEFFVNAMKRCCINLHDVELALRIDRLLNTGDNFLLLGDSRVENMYYSFFLKIVCTFETMDKIMEVYQRVTPHLWTANFSVLEEMLKAVEMQDGHAYLPLLWTDLLLFEFLRNAALLETLLRLMAVKRQQPELQAQFKHIARELLQRWSNEREEGRQPSLSTGAMIGRLIAIAENSDDHELAWTVFETYTGNRNAFSGLPDDDAMLALVGGCLEVEGSDGLERAMTIIKAMSSLEMAGTTDAAQLVLSSDKVELSSSQRDLLGGM